MAAPCSAPLPENQDKPLPARPDYKQLLNANPIRLITAVVFGPPKVFDVVVPLERNDQPFVYHSRGRPHHLSARGLCAMALRDAFALMGFALGIALLVAFLLSNLALRPLEEISMQLDYWTAASESAEEDEAESEAGYRGARLDQDRADRPAHAQRGRGLLRVEGQSRPDPRQPPGRHPAVYRGRARGAGIGGGAALSAGRTRQGSGTARLANLRPVHASWAQALGEAFDTRVPLVKEEIRTETGRRIQASLDFIHDDIARQGLGALVTLRDLESMEEIESELELSRRMAAIGRLTSGVAHEVKNPINAIVVHLELLQEQAG